MKTKLFCLTLVALLALGMSACAPVKTNADFVLEMIALLNAGDVEGSLEYFADDAVISFYGLSSTGFERYTGKTQIKYIWRDSAAANFVWEAEVVSEEDNIVTVEARTYHDFTRELGVAPLEYHDVYELVDGKIITYVSWLDAESYARFRPAFEAAVPPDPPAPPPSGPGASVLNVTTRVGTCTTDNPVALQAGEVTVNWKVEDQQDEDYTLKIFSLDPGKDMMDLMVATYGMPPAWAQVALDSEMGPGESTSENMTIGEGTAYLICWSKPPDRPIGIAILPVVP